jgi:hypothetical protein
LPFFKKSSGATEQNALVAPLLFLLFKELHMDLIILQMDLGRQIKMAEALSAPLPLLYIDF